MEFNVYNSLHSNSRTDAVLEIENKGSFAEVKIIKSEYPSLVNISAIADLIDRHTYNQYASKCGTSSFSIREFANGRLTSEINELEEKLEEMKFIRKVARRRDIRFVDMTGGEK